MPEISDILTDSSIGTQEKLKKVSNYCNSFRLKKKELDDIQIYARLFLYGSFSYLPSDIDLTESVLRKNYLARSTSRIINQLDSLGHLEDYLSFYLQQMCKMGFPQYAVPFVKNNNQFSQEADFIALLSPSTIKEKFVDSNKLKQMLAEAILSSNKTSSVESLLALNTFWANRYSKELNMYLEAMFAVHEFGLIDKILSGKETSVSEEEIKEMLCKTNSFYFPANKFLRSLEDKVNSLSWDSLAEHSKSAKSTQEKQVRFSYDPFLSQVEQEFGDKYFNYFSKTLPDSTNDLSSDANWFIRLYNPIYSSYSIKDESISALISSITNSKTSNFTNAGVILNDNYSDGTYADLSNMLILGIDANLSYPVRLHFKKDVVIDFLKSFNGNAIMPIYEGSDDFRDPNNPNKPLSTHVIVPLNDKLRKMLKDPRGKASKSNYPNFISHLGFIDPKKPPEHLCEITVKPSGKKGLVFKRRYIDLETGTIYTKDEKDVLQAISSSKEEATYGTK